MENVKDPDQARYILGRVHRSGRQLLLQMPDVDRWRALIKDKKIPGVIKQIKRASGEAAVEVTAGPLAPTDINFILAEERAALFMQPTALVKVSD